MIRVTVELVSAVSRDRDKILGVAEIANVGGNASKAHYRVWLSRWAPMEKKAWKANIVTLDRAESEAMIGNVEAFDKVNRGAWDLLYLCLKGIVGGRNPR